MEEEGVNHLEGQLELYAEIQDLVLLLLAALGTLERGTVLTKVSLKMR
jgi:hypothetical protein